MAPRRTYRSVKVISNNVYNNLSLNDVLCPICRSILVEPVTLPCSHGFCFACFEGTMANASLTCPLCRIRYSSWHRVAKKENRIINVDLWKAIKKAFPQQLLNKQNGREDNLVQEAPRRLATPGVIRREYEAQKLKDELELKMQREAETKASEDLLRKIREEEEFDESVREEKILFDEHVARQLAKELNFKAETSTAAKNSRTSKKSRPLDKFLHGMKHKNLNVSLQTMTKSECAEITKIKKTSVESKSVCQDKKLSHCSLNKTMSSSTNDFKHNSLRKLPAAAEVGDSNDSIENECRYFKPIDLKNIPASKSIIAVKVPAKMHSACTVIVGAPTGKMNFTHNFLSSAFARFEMFSPILGTPQAERTRILSPLAKRMPGKKRKLTDNSLQSENCSLLADMIETPIRETRRLNSGKKSSSQKHNTFNLSRRSGIRRSNRLSSLEKTPEKNTVIKSNLENSPNTRSKQKILNQIYSNNLNLGDNAMVSPPFHGFDLRKNKTQEHSSAATTNNLKLDEALLRRKLQEESDLELAKKLQEEFNNVRYSTRSSIIQNDKPYKKRRQVTLDEIIISRSRVK